MLHATSLARRRTLARRLARSAAIVVGLLAAALGVGALGYHDLDDLPWLDATLNAAMILTGMGPVKPVERIGDISAREG